MTPSHLTMEKQQNCEQEEIVEKYEDFAVLDCLSPEEMEREKKLVRKIDLYILPCMWFMYLLSYMDRTKCVSLTLSPELKS